jgi:hypothetical protein
MADDLDDMDFGTNVEDDRNALRAMIEVSPPEGTEKQKKSGSDARPPEDESEALTDGSESDPDANEEDSDEDSDEDNDEQETEEATEEALDVSDEDLIEVKVDGEVVYKTIAEAKAALSSVGAVQNQLREIHSQKLELDDTITKEAQKMREAREQFMAVVQSFSKELLTPRVAQPNEALSRTNPAQYTAQFAAWQADQLRLQNVNAKLAATVNGQKAANDADMARFIDAEERKLIAREPAFGDKAKAQVIMNDIVREATEYYGFSKDEVGMTTDHRVFLMAMDAAKWRMSQRSKPKGQQKMEQEVNAPRVVKKLRSGVAEKQRMANKAAREAYAVRQRAAKTGKDEDVLGLIMEKAPQRKRS